MDGVINVNKPIGITSFDVVRKLKKVYGTNRVGHTGTLDPLACGVLPVCINKATKIADYIMSETKVYKTKLRLGIETDTYDREGKIISESLVDLDEGDVISAVKSFMGEIKQEPPMYSAIKVNGEKLYNLARKGIVVEREKREIVIYNIDINNISLPYVDFTVTCSKGTYIRSLCYDIGKMLKVGATMWALKRLQTGMFKLENSITLEQIESSDHAEQFLTTIESALESYEKISFAARYEKLLLNGVKINNIHIIEGIKFNIIYRVYIDENNFIGLGKRDDYGFKIIKLLN